MFSKVDDLFNLDPETNGRWFFEPLSKSCSMSFELPEDTRRVAPASAGRFILPLLAQGPSLELAKNICKRSGLDELGRFQDVSDEDSSISWTMNLRVMEDLTKSLAHSLADNVESPLTEKQELWSLFLTALENPSGCRPPIASICEATMAGLDESDRGFAAGATWLPLAIVDRNPEARRKLLETAFGGPKAILPLLAEACQSSAWDADLQHFALDGGDAPSFLTAYLSELGGQIPRGKEKEAASGALSKVLLKMLPDEKLCSSKERECLRNVALSEGGWPADEAVPSWVSIEKLSALAKEFPEMGALIESLEISESLAPKERGGVCVKTL